MTKFIIEDNFYLGDTPNGPSISYGRSEIELNENEINQLISLIKEKNSTDIEELNLEHKNPGLYRRLYDATCEAVKMADEDWCYSYAYFEGEGEDEENENLVKDYDKMIKYAEVTYGYQYDFEEDLRQTGELEELHPGLNFEPNNINFFERWLFHSERNIRLDILLNVVGMELVNIDVDELSLYDIQPQIPREIIKMAKQY